MVFYSSVLPPFEKNPMEHVLVYEAFSYPYFGDPNMYGFQHKITYIPLSQPQISQIPPRLLHSNYQFQNQSWKHKFPQLPYYNETTGGVSANLDYELNNMSNFITSMVLGILKISSNNEPFRTFALRILTVTRLPKATIILSLVYLSKRCAESLIESPSQSYIHCMFIVSLQLANKFNDDNTFTNRSWSQATGIDVQTLTTLEIDWLNKMHWSLHLDSTDIKGWHRWNDCWNYWIANSSRLTSSMSSFPTFKANSTSSTSSRSFVSFSKTNSPEKPFYTVPKWYHSINNNRPTHAYIAPFSYFHQSFATPPISSNGYDNKNLTSHYNSICNCAQCAFNHLPKHLVAC